MPRSSPVSRPSSASSFDSRCHSFRGLVAQAGGAGRDPGGGSRLGVVQAALAGVAAQPHDVAGQGLSASHRRLTLKLDQTIRRSRASHRWVHKSSRRIARSDRFSSGYARQKKHSSAPTRPDGATDDRQDPRRRTPSRTRMRWPPSCRGRPRSTRCSAGSRASATSTSVSPRRGHLGRCRQPGALRRAAQADHRHGLQRGRARRVADPISRPRPARVRPPGLGLVGERRCSPAMEIIP